MWRRRQKRRKKQDDTSTSNSNYNSKSKSSNCTSSSSKNTCKNHNGRGVGAKCLSHENHYIALMQWMKRNGFDCKICKLRPAEFSETGRGLMTRKRLMPGDTLVEIPRNLLITANDVLQTEIGPVLKRQVQKPSPQQVVCIFLIMERSKVTLSFWHPYINVLPSTFTTPACCSSNRSDLDYLPEPTRSKAIAQLSTIRSAFQNASHLFEDIERTFPQYHGLFDFGSFVWAWFVINSRSVYMEQEASEFLDCREKNDFALAPFLDLLNHSPSAEVQAGFSSSSGCYEIKTLTSYSAYDQVFIHYGPHDNSSLLLEYGFVIPGNPHDVYCFHLDSVLRISKLVCEGCHRSQSAESESMWKRKAAILDSENLCRDLSCMREGASWRLLTALRILCMDFSELQSWKRIVGSGLESSSSRRLVHLAVQKLSGDAIVEVQSNLKMVSDGLLKSSDYLQMVKLLWVEQLNILQATHASAAE